MIITEFEKSIFDQADSNYINETLQDLMESGEFDCISNYCHFLNIYSCERKAIAKTLSVYYFNNGILQ